MSEIIPIDIARIIAGSYDSGNYNVNGVSAATVAISNLQATCKTYHRDTQMTAALIKSIYWLSTSTKPRSWDFLWRFREHIDWTIYTMLQSDLIYSIEFVRKFQNYIDWEVYSENCPATPGFLREFQNHIRWDVIVKTPLSEKVILEFIDLFDINALTSYQPVTPMILTKLATMGYDVSKYYLVTTLSLSMSKNLN